MKTYDAVVVGSGVGGLSTALHLACAGKSVAVLEARDVFGGKAAALDVAGITTDPGPSILILKHLYEKTFSDIGFSAKEVGLEWLPLSHLSRISYQGVQYDLPIGRDDFLSFCKQEFPNDVAGFEWLLAVGDRVYSALDETLFSRNYGSAWDFLQLFRALPLSGVQLLRSYTHLVETKFSHPAIKGFLYDFPTYVGATPSKPVPAAWMILYSMIVHGVWFVKGGVHTIPDQIVTLCRQNGVEFYANSQVKQLKSFTTGWRATTETREEFAAQAVVVNADPLVAHQLLATDSSKLQAKTRKHSFSYCTLTYKLAHVAGLGHHELVVPRNYNQAYSDLFSHSQSASSEYVVYLNTPLATDSSCDSYLFAVVPVSTHARSEMWTHVLTSLDNYIQTYCKDAYGLSDLELIATQTPLTFEQRDGNPRGSLFGFGSSLFGLLPQQQRIDNKLWCVGGAVQPGAGVPMVLRGGAMVADQVLREI